MKTKIDKYKVIMLILRFVYWAIALLVIYMVILKLTGHSSTTGDIALIVSGGMWVFFSSLAINFSRQLGRIESDIKHLTKLVYTIGEDLKNHINDPYAHQKKKYITR